MTESRIIGSLNDFIFIESPKIILPIKKSEKIIKVKATSKRKAHTRKITFEGKKEVTKRIVKSSHDFIKNEIGLNIDMREGDKFTNDPLMGEQIIVSDSKGNKLDVWVKETSDMIQLSTIGAQEKGTGLGTKYLLGLKDYANFSGKKLVIPNMTPGGKKYFSRFDWLQDDHIKLEWIEDGEHQEYYPEDTMSYMPKEKVKKSSLDTDNLTEINPLEDSGINVVGGVHEEDTYICKFKDGSSAIHKVMMAGDIAGEVGTYEISKIAGWDVVPETIQHNYGRGEGSTQKWIKDGEEPIGDFYGGVTLGEKHLNDLSKIFILDMINGNFDRHEGNLIIDKQDHVWAIDNECIGKRKNSEFHIEGLEQFAKEGTGSYLPIFGILENNFGDDPKMYQKFKEHVDKNIDIILTKKDEIIKYWNQYDKDMKVFYNAIPMKDAIKVIKENIEYLENYRGKL